MAQADFGELTERLQEAPVTDKATPRLRPDAVRRRLGARRRTSRAASRSRRCCGSTPALDRDVRRDRRDEPDRDLGRRARWQTYSDQQEQAFAELSEEVFPGRLTDRTDTSTQHHHNSTAGVAGRGSRPLLLPVWRTFPGARRATSLQTPGAERTGTWPGEPGRTQHQQHRSRVESMSSHASPARRVTPAPAPRTARRVRHEVRDALAVIAFSAAASAASPWPCCCSRAWVG